MVGSLVAKVVANSTLTQAECYPGTSNSEQQVLSLNPFRNPFTGATEVVAGSDGGRDGEAPSAPTSTTTYSIVYVHTDALGSPIAETNINATVIPGSRTQYEPYGKPLTTPREGAPSYTGHQYDTSTGLIYAQQRYYDPALGRFLSTDPMAVDMGAAGNWNRYAYAANNPYRYFDPDGRCTGSHITNDDGTCKSTGGFTTESTRASGGNPAAGMMNFARKMVDGIRGDLAEIDSAIMAGEDPPPGVVIRLAVMFSPLGAEAAPARSLRMFTEVGEIAAVGTVETVSGAQRGISVLGRHPAYVELAEAIPSRHFSVPTWVWNRMTPTQQWAANTRFLDRLISRGDEVYLATRASSAAPGTYFARELEYMTSRGYTVSDDGWRLVPVGQ
ncbi:MAG: RHS repeat-associated core domain-containing protein [Xanthomonadales bacterium]|nr:RHS repeat-associated core domain-containing protein [Xanthomonadales bacterium]